MSHSPKQRAQRQWSWNKKVLSGIEAQLKLLRHQYIELRHKEPSRTDVYESAQFIADRIARAQYNVSIALLELDALAEHQGLRVGITEQRKTERAERAELESKVLNATPAA